MATPAARERDGAGRASQTGRAPRRAGPLGWVRLRLRAKLTAVLVLAALVPMAVVATIAVGVVLSTLERGLHSETERQRGVGLNLVLRTVERLGDDAARLSAMGDLARAMVEGKAAVAMLLAGQAAQLPSSLVQVTDADGQPVADLVVGGDDARFAGLGLDGASEAVRLGRRWGRRVTLELVGDRLVMRAVAPVVDGSLALLGVVVLTVPLDGAFADGIRSALGAEVLIAAASSAGARSSFRDALGARLPEVAVPAAVRARITGGAATTASQPIGWREYEVAWTALVDHRGATVGVFGVAVDRGSVSSAKTVAFRSLAIGGAVALLFALGLAAVLSRRIGQPIGRLHRGAVAIARGDLDHRIDVGGTDEIGELAQAFRHMTTALKENQQRLAARMREIVALHDAGRAMSSVIEPGQVSRKVVDAVARTFDGQLCALWLLDGGGELAIAAARARRPGRGTQAGADASGAAAGLTPIAREVADTRAHLRIERVADDARRGDRLRAAGVDGSMVSAPLERKGAVVGVILVARAPGERPFTEADASLLATFADQAATAIENARLYAQVVGASEELERKVRLRTAELTQINLELGKTLADLQETQSQLILSERMAGLGLLVAGVAHEINSPSAAVRGSVEAMGEVVSRLTRHLDALAALGLPAARREAIVAWVESTGRALAAQRLPTGAAVRRAQRELRARLDAAGLDDAAAQARDLAEIGLEPDALAPFVALVAGEPRGLPVVVAGYLSEYVHLHRNVLTIHNAIGRIQRIVGALKSYSHLDQSAGLVEADLHEGIETTLTILDYALRAIPVSRSYGTLPRVPIFVDELNQVWTNLLQNAAQALEGHGTISIETGIQSRDPGARAGVFVRVIDDGPGIPADVLPRIFQPFFTTKSKGEGTGLGLGIVKRIVDKHRGEISCESRPGRTCFTVWLPQDPAAAPVAVVPPATEAELSAELTGEMTIERSLLSPAGDGGGAGDAGDRGGGAA
jgi:signal transduction histidine kinase